MSYLQQHSAVGVHIGPGVLGLALLQEHVGHNLVKLGDHLEHGVVGQVLQGKLALAGVTWVCLPQDSMAVAWHNLRRETTTFSSTSELYNSLYYLLSLQLIITVKCSLKKKRDKL